MMQMDQTITPQKCTSSTTCKLYKSIIIGLISITEPPWNCLSSRRKTSIALRPALNVHLLPNSSQIYLAQYIHIVIVIFIALFILITKNDILLSLLDRWLEDFIRPRILLSPAVALVLILEIVISDIRIPIGNTDINSFIFEHPRYFFQHLL